MSLSKLAVISCHFNPFNFRKPQENLRYFRRHMKESGVDLFDTHLMFREGEPEGARFELYGDLNRQCLFIKESILNWTERRVPAEYDAIAWIDCDVQFLNRNWVSDTLAALEKHKVVQLFKQPFDVMTDGSMEPLKPSVGYHFRNRPTRMLAPRMHKSHPGFAWAMRRECWEKIGGLYEYNISGGGDCLLADGFIQGARSLNIPRVQLSSRLSKGQTVKFDEWFEKACKHLNGKLGYIPGTLLHYLHGPRSNRQYNTRWRMEHDYQLDPDKHLERDENGILRWSEQVPLALRDHLWEYLKQRKEDHPTSSNFHFTPIGEV